MDVGQRDLGGETGVDRAVFAALPPQLLRACVREHDVACTDTQALQVSAHERRHHVVVEDARDADAQFGAAGAGHLAAAHKGPAYRPASYRTASEPDPAHHLIVDRAASGRHRRRIVAVPEHRSGFVIHQVRITRLEALARLVERHHRLLGLDRAFLTGKSGDVAAGGALRRTGVNEGSCAEIVAEATAGGGVGTGGVFEMNRRLQADEAGLTALLDLPPRLQGGADGAGLTAMRMHPHLGPRHARTDIVHLGLDRRQVVLGAALEDKLAAEFGQPRDLHHVLPDVFRQHLRQTGEQLLAGKTFLLEIDPVGVQEYRAAVGKARCQARLESDVGEVAQGHTELIGHRLQQHPVTGGTLVGKPETLDHPVLQEQHLDVLTADVADHVHVVAAVALGAHHVGHGFDNVGIGLQRLIQHIGGITGGAETEYLEIATAGPDLVAQFGQQAFGIVDGIAPGQAVGLDQQLALRVDQHRLGAGGAAIQADIAAHTGTGRQRGRVEDRHLIVPTKHLQILALGEQPRPGRLTQLRPAVVADEGAHARGAAIGQRLAGGLHAEHHGAEGGIVLGIFRHPDTRFRAPVAGRCVAPLRPGLRDAQTPGRLQKRQVGIRPAQQQHLRLQGVAAGQHRQVLHHNGVGQ